MNNYNRKKRRSRWKRIALSLTKMHITKKKSSIPRRHLRRATHVQWIRSSGFTSSSCENNDTSVEKPAALREEVDASKALSPSTFRMQIPLEHSIVLMNLLGSDPFTMDPARIVREKSTNHQHCSARFLIPRGWWVFFFGSRCHGWRVKCDCQMCL